MKVTGCTKHSPATIVKASAQNARPLGMMGNSTQGFHKRVTGSFIISDKWREIGLLAGIRRGEPKVKNKRRRDERSKKGREEMEKEADEVKVWKIGVWRGDVGRLSGKGEAAEDR